MTKLDWFYKKIREALPGYTPLSSGMCTSVLFTYMKGNFDDEASVQIAIQSGELISLLEKEEDKSNVQGLLENSEIHEVKPYQMIIKGKSKITAALDFLLKFVKGSLDWSYLTANEMYLEMTGLKTREVNEADLEAVVEGAEVRKKIAHGYEGMDIFIAYNEVYVQKLKLSLLNEKGVSVTGQVGENIKAGVEYESEKEAFIKLDSGECQAGVVIAAAFRRARIVDGRIRLFEPSRTRGVVNDLEPYLSARGILSINLV